MKQSVARLEHAVDHAKRSLMTAITEVAPVKADREILVREIRQAIQDALEVSCQEADGDWEKVRTDDGLGAALEHAEEHDISSRLMKMAVRAYAIALGRLMIQQALEEERTTARTPANSAAEAEAFALRSATPRRSNHQRVSRGDCFDATFSLRDFEEIAV